MIARTHPCARQNTTQGSIQACPLYRLVQSILSNLCLECKRAAEAALAAQEGQAGQAGQA